MSDTTTPPKGVPLEIDGVAVVAQPGQMIIEAADEAGVYIPRFCYHKHLSIAANCRMCLVEVDGIKKPMPACATPVGPGMKVLTASARARAAQKATMEFLLVNHPLDCPICDQGGECELQDLALGYGRDVSRFSERKRVVADQDIGPLVATDMTRCIHCTRCVRFGAEIAGLRELGATGRAENMRIGTFVEQSLASELSGNIIDLCPVGALTSKPYRFRARAWELTQHPGISPHDCIGANVAIHVRRGEILRVAPQDNPAVNETWLADRDRFAYLGLNSPERLRQPLIRRAAGWEPTDWPTALQAAAAGLQEVIRQHGAAQLGTLLAPQLDTETLYLASKLTRAAGSPHVDHRLRQGDFRADGLGQGAPWLGMTPEALARADVIVLLGANPRKEQPLLAHRIRQAALRGAQVVALNASGLPWNFATGQDVVLHPGQWVGACAALAKALAKLSHRKIPDACRTLPLAAVETMTALAKALKAARCGVIMLGAQAQAHPDYALLWAWCAQLAQEHGLHLGIVPEANGVGAYQVGALPQADGLAAQAQWEARLRAYLLVGLEPEHDTGNPASAEAALAQAQWVVALSAYHSPTLERYARVILPIAEFGEYAGSRVNGAGLRQAFPAAIQPPGEARPAWKVLRVLANHLQLPGFAYNDLAEVQAALAALAPVPLDNGLRGGCDLMPRLPPAGLVRCGATPLYASDPLVRRAPALQATPDAQAQAQARLHPETAARLGLTAARQVWVQQGDCGQVFTLNLDAGLAPDVVGLPGSVATLGASCGPVELTEARS